MTNSVLIKQQPFPKFPDAFNTGPVLTKPYRLAFNVFHPKIRLCLHKGRYTVKTVSEPAELEKVLQLRHEVFCIEKAGRTPYIGIDWDRFDLICDHLMVIDRLSSKIVGTYRLNSSLFTKNFYSAKEFNIDNIIKLPGTKLELGRACIHKEFRNGIMIALLWRGICEYMKMTGTKYLFGCSSVDTTDHEEINNIYNYFLVNHYSQDNLRVFPKIKYTAINRNLMRGHILSNDGTINRVHQYSTDIHNSLEHLKNNAGKGCSTKDREQSNSASSSSNNDIAIPPLIKAYLRAGAVICGEPALDSYFRCTDFFTFLDVELMNKSIERRFS